jgi:DUF4097 and DUF4098 domain-containing protein YvlB
MLRALHLSAVLAASLVLTGCDDWADWGNTDRYKEDFHFTHDLKSGGRLSVENLNGSIEIQSWDKDSVDITGTKYASTEQVLEAMKIDVVAPGDFVRIRTISPSGHRGNHGARYVIRVPRRTELDRIQTSNGRISVDGIEGTARLRTSNGAIRADRIAGELEAETSNGSVELNDHDGPANVRTTNGAIRAEDVRGYFEATTSNGSITAKLSDPTPGRPVKLQSSNGSISLTMDSLRNNDIRVATSNSSITLQLPGDLKAQVKAHTSNSSITSDFEVATGGTVSKHDLEGTIGGGGPVIDVSTSNGAIKILKI